MTARTALTPVQLVGDGAISEGSGTSIAGLVSAGATIAAPPGPNRVLLIVNNSYSAAKNVTVRAGGSGVTAAGATAVAVPFEAAAAGDLVVNVAASGTQVIALATSARFTQADGSLSIDFDTAMTGTITVLALPNSHLQDGF